MIHPQPSGEACDEQQREAALRQRAAAGCRAIAHMLMRVGACGGRTRLELRASACGGFGPPHLRAMRVRVAACEAHATSNRSRPTKKAGFAETKPAVLVELPGFEPRIPEPKSDVLPLHHSSIRCSKAGQRYTIFFNWQPRSPFFARGFFGRTPTGHQQSCGVGSEQVPTRNRLDKRPPRKVFPAEPPRTSLSRKLPTPVWP